MADQHEVDLDSIIDRLLEVRGSRPGKQVQLLESEIRFLCTKAREIFISQPILLELEAPIKVCFRLDVLSLFHPHRRTGLRRFCACSIHHRYPALPQLHMDLPWNPHQKN